MGHLRKTRKPLTAPRREVQKSASQSEAKIELLKLRAAGRAKLAAPSYPPNVPNIKMLFVNPGNTPSDLQRGGVYGGPKFKRSENESEEAFKARVYAATIIGKPYLVWFTPRQPEPSPDSVIAVHVAADGTTEAFQSRPGETLDSFTDRLELRWGPDAKFGSIQWPSHEPCPCQSDTCKVEETAARGIFLR
jgi:hypothetical protein